MSSFLLLNHALFSFCSLCEKLAGVVSCFLGFMAGYTDILAVKTHSSAFLSVIKEENCRASGNKGNWSFFN